LKTFRILMMARQYRGFQPNAKYLNNEFLLRRIYRHFVFYVVRHRAKDEAAKAGTATLKADLSKAYKRRGALAQARAKYAKQSGYPRRVVRLLEDPECNSDDDADANGSRYSIRAMPNRSSLVLDLIRTVIDPERL
ncbi:hypothetical protein CYLTODRAFT_332840, partial [Cylindrobasidium torrendii FP15055 ss-10]